MPKETRPRLLVSLVLSFVGLCDAGHARASSSSQHPVCKEGLEFWSANRSSCWPCTRCAPQITISPCAVYKDAICGPLSALEFDWSFLSTRKRPETGHAGQRRLEAVTSKMLRQLPAADVEQQQPRQQRRRENEDSEDAPNPVDEKDDQPEASSSRQMTKRQHDPRERRKSEAEENNSNNNNNLPWDWQSGALVLAVCACIVFFLVAGCSALVYARQWRRMKKNFEPAGLEEISARLNCMVKAELAELVAGAPMNPGDPETRCQYLEKLLDRKRETPVVVVGCWPEVGGNLYIEEGDTPRSKRSQIARIHRNIETILSHKAASRD